MPAGSMGALLQALKAAQSKGGGLPDEEDIGKPIAAKLSIMHAKPIDDGEDDMGDLGDLSDTTSPPEDESEGDDAEYNADMVTALQENYPEIYAKLDKQVQAQDKAGPATEPDKGPADLSDMM